MVTRRRLLGRAGVIGASGVIAGPAHTRVVARMTQGDGATAVPAAIALDLRSGDVWAWTKELTGTCAGIPEDAAIGLLVNGTSMPSIRDGDVFRADIRLDPGENEIIAVASLANGREERSEPVTHTVRLDPRPTSRIRASVRNGRVTFDGTASEPSDHDQSAIVRWRWSQRKTNPTTLDLVPADGDTASPVAGGASRVSSAAPLREGEYYVTLEIEDEQGRNDASSVCIIVEDGAVRVMDPVTEEAAWIGDAVVYGMVVRNFTSEGFAGVTSRLDELGDLGVTALWFAPITRTVGDLFGYEVTDYFDLRPEYGTLDDFRALVDAAHARGVRVLMDFVPNHTSIEHPYYQDAEAHGTASPYYTFYDRDSGGTATHYFSWDHLPNLNFENPEVRRFMTEAFAYWVRELGVDGFRVDVAWGIKQRRPDYWLELSAELNRIKPDLLLIAEASARDPFYVQNGFDAAYDWTDELGVWAWGDVFAKGFPLSKEMPEALTADGDGYDPDSLIMRFLNNNDTGMRFVSVYGVNRYRAALALLLTLPGTPCLYTGDEIGAQFEPYETTEEIAWDDPNDLRPYVRQLVQLRHAHPAFQTREWRQIEVEPTVEMFGYLRPMEGESSIGVIMNYSAKDLEAVVSLPPELMGVPLVDLWTGEPVAEPDGGALTLAIPAWECRFLQAGAGANQYKERM